LGVWAAPLDEGVSAKGLMRTTLLDSAVAEKDAGVTVRGDSREKGATVIHLREGNAANGRDLYD